MIAATRWLMLAGAIALGVAGLYLSALILALGVILLTPFDLPAPSDLEETE